MLCYHVRIVQQSETECDKTEVYPTLCIQAVSHSISTCPSLVITYMLSFLLKHKT